MRKIFLSTMPMQGVSAFNYKSDEYTHSSDTAYPITILLENNCQTGDTAVMLTIVTESETQNLAEENYQLFSEQVKKTASEKGFSVELIKIGMSAKSNAASHRELYKKLLEQINDGDEIHADITYGFKSTPIVIFTALNQAYQTKNNIDITEIMYGNLYNGSSEKTPELFDVTSLFYLNSLSGVLGSMNDDSNNKQKFMKMLLD